MFTTFDESRDVFNNTEVIVDEYEAVKCSKINHINVNVVAVLDDGESKRSIKRWR